ncbi:hypothetical protein, partial [Xenorhabdus bovienii]|uniref:hypothetical protein n=1 Tax=Xenorhabdus bovienii TaxID=40576 RepID=UPI0023B2B496
KSKTTPLNAPNASLFFILVMRSLAFTLTGRSPPKNHNWGCVFLSPAGAGSLCFMAQRKICWGRLFLVYFRKLDAMRKYETEAYHA